MQMFRSRNDCYEQSYNNQSSTKPFFGTKPAIGYGGGNNLTHCQNQTQCFDAQVFGADTGTGYGSMQQYAFGDQDFGLQKPYSQFGAQQGSYESVQHGGHGGTTHHQSSHGSMMQGGGYNGSTQHHASHGNRIPNEAYAFGLQQGGYDLSHDTAHYGPSFGSGYEGQSGGGYKYSMKKKEKRWGRSRTRSGNDSDSDGSCSDDSDHDKN